MEKILTGFPEILQKKMLITVVFSFTTIMQILQVGSWRHLVGLTAKKEDDSLKSACQTLNSVTNYFLFIQYSLVWCIHQIYFRGILFSFHWFINFSTSPKSKIFFAMFYPNLVFPLYICYVQIEIINKTGWSRSYWYSQKS